MLIMTIDIEAPEFITLQRKKRGIRQYELAQRLGWSRSVLAKIESGRRDLRAGELEVILAALYEQSDTRN